MKQGPYGTAAVAAALRATGTLSENGLLPAELPRLAPPRRRKLWELEGKHHCPIIGTCLSMEELVRFAKRFGLSASLHDEFALHVETVSSSRTRNPLSEALQKHLDGKYALAIRRFEAARSDAEVRELWQQHLARGDVAGPLWAACCHKASSAETLQRLYADVHMLSHQVGAGQATDARRLSHLEAENATLRHELAAERLERAHLQGGWRKQLEDLEAQFTGLRSQLADQALLRERLARFESGQVFAEMTQQIEALQRHQDQLLARARRAEEFQAALAASREEVQRLSAECEQLKTEREALEQRLQIQEASAPPQPPRDIAPGNNAGPQCVLCVGGRTPLLPQYRALAVRLGIRLIHHDGGQEEALSRLPELIQGADAVLCPTDCVSHSAYYQLKSHCKRSGKPCLLFKGAGVSSFAAALVQLSGGQFSLPAKAGSERRSGLPLS